MKKITASIVIYNEKRETLQRVIENFLSLPFTKELVIIDNSPLDTLTSLCHKYEHLIYIFSGENLGFGKAHNLGFSNLTLKSDVHMIINPDTYFLAHEMLAYLTWMAEEKEVALSTPKVCNPDGSTQNVVRNIPTPLSLIKRKFNPHYDELSVRENTVEEIPFAHGCFMVFQTEVFEKMGGFDERYFMYMEDIDIWIRAKQYGKTVINTHSKIYHEHRKGSSKSLKLLCFHLSSAYKFFMKRKL